MERSIKWEMQGGNGRRVARRRDGRSSHCSYLTHGAFIKPDVLLPMCAQAEEYFHVFLRCREEVPIL